MKKKFILLYLISITFLFISKISLGQVGIGTQKPKHSAILDISFPNKGVLLPSVTLQSISDQNTVPSPVKGLIVYNTQNSGEGDQQVLANNLYIWNNDHWDLLITEDKAVLESDTSGIAVFKTYLPLNDYIVNNLRQPLFLIEDINTINQYINFDFKNNEFTIQPGVYTISLNIEATHNAKGCTLSSYFVDFPLSRKKQILMPHVAGSIATHGGLFQSSFIIKEPYKKYKISIGRGEGGNCYGKGMTLHNAQLSITRIGDI